MLASTVSITAANPAARSETGGDEKVTSRGNGRDLSHHSIRGDAVLDRSSKDFVQAKKAVGSSTAVQRRPRKMLANDVSVSPVIANPGASGDEKVTSRGNGRDLSHHSFRGDAILDRSSKDFMQAKKAVGNSTAVQRLTCKVLPKPDKPRWLTGLRFFAKNFVLLVVLVGLVQLICTLALKSGETAVGPQLGLVEFEGRIADVESLLKTTAKMIQVQVDVVDWKIENEIRGLKKEINKKIDD
ncbi:hypothetical protein K1719_042043 [Acacia pycnantha]|nr:hypothetical protein K1719_042043 [Acacia pycnantha]